MTIVANCAGCPVARRARKSRRKPQRTEQLPEAVRATPLDGGAPSFAEAGRRGTSSGGATSLSTRLRMLEGGMIEREETVEIVVVSEARPAPWSGGDSSSSSSSPERQQQRRGCSTWWHLAGEAASLALLGCTVTQRDIGSWRWQLAASLAGVTCAAVAASGDGKVAQLQKSVASRSSLHLFVCVCVGATIVVRVVLAIELVSLVALENSAECVEASSCYWSGDVDRRSRCSCRTIDCYASQSRCSLRTGKQCGLYPHAESNLFYSRRLDSGEARIAFSTQRDCYRFYLHTHSQLACVFLLVVFTAALLPCEYATLFRAWHGLRVSARNANRRTDLRDNALRIDPDAPLAHYEIPSLTPARPLDDDDDVDGAVIATACTLPTPRFSDALAATRGGTDRRSDDFQLRY